MTIEPELSDAEGLGNDARARALELARMLGRSLADAIMPPICVCCRAPLSSRDTLCVACWSDVRFIRPPLCDRLGVPMPFDTGGTMVSAAATAEPPDYDRARAVAAYEGTARRLVHDLKFRDRHDARSLLARWLAMAGRELLGDCDVVVPIPLNRDRLIWRRFNQAALLAQEVARMTGKAFEPLALVRTRSTRSQIGLTRIERAKNVRGALAVPPHMVSRIAPRRVLLLDDIITTGATVSAAARALKRAGAAQVDVLAVAMVIDDGLVPA